MLLQLAGDEAVIAQKPNYLQDDTFSGKFNNNPFHSAIDAKGFVPINPQRIYVRPKVDKTIVPIDKSRSNTPNINLRSPKKANEKLEEFLKPWQEYSGKKNEE